MSNTSGALQSPRGCSHLVSQRCQVPFEALVFALQRLDAGQVVAVVVGVESLVLLFNPFFSFVSISEDTNAKKKVFPKIQEAVEQLCPTAITGIDFLDLTSASCSGPPERNRHQDATDTQHARLAHLWNRCTSWALPSMWLRSSASCCRERQRLFSSCTNQAFRHEGSHMTPSKSKDQRPKHANIPRVLFHSLKKADRQTDGRRDGLHVCL